MNKVGRQLEREAHSRYQKPLKELTTHQLHTLVAHQVMSHISPAWEKTVQKRATRRRAYYLSAEYLMGRLVHNNLLCSGLFEETADALAEQGRDLAQLEEIEDAALGNGGLGRLAACFLDSAATVGVPLDGYGIRYRYGLFRQRLENGFQQEEPDDWTRFGDPWSVRREEDAVTVTFGDGAVRAVPYDMPVIGYGGRCVGTLRLWQSEALMPFDFALFNDQKYDAALREKNRAEDISRALYPNDTTPAGRLLRLKQQYFFSSASVQDLLRRFEAVYGAAYEKLPEMVTVQLNDTHPVIAVPELVRLLTLRGMSFDEAVRIAERVFCYTNHTVMQEAMEKWDLATVRKVSPAIATLLRRMSARFEKELDERGVAVAEREALSILQGDTVHMAHLACRYSAHINGVAQLHTDILRRQVLGAWNRLYPDKIKNVTNGITQRRWLRLCNPSLSALLTELLGDDGWLVRPERLTELARYASDEGVLERFAAIKRANKVRLAATLSRREGVQVSPDALFDVQIKRLHEYKRQLLNILCVLELYFELQEGTLTDFPPTVFLFGAKAAPGYLRAKGIIKLIHEVGALINKDERIRRLVQVVFVTDYNVSYAEQIVAAADVSEQISTAGTEASGTGNMKLMANGAVTLGTYDGANIEIVAAAGEENNYIFGAREEDIRRLKESGYRARDRYEQDPRIRRCLDAMVDGTLSDGGTGLFRELYTALLDGASWHAPDHYFVLADFDACLAAKKQVAQDYLHDRRAFYAKQWRNVCAAGPFSSDRAIREYARKIWRLTK